MKISAGLVIIHNNKILLGHPTNSKWYGTYSIPKGGVENKENLFEAAVRETEEEIGIKLLDTEFKYIDKDVIKYRDEKGKMYKKVYYFVVNLTNSIQIKKEKLQIEEIDWAGFLTKEEAEKRIFWRMKPVLKYLK